MQPVAVAVLGQLAPELVDEQPAVGEDQHAFGARRLDEARGGDRLAGRGRVAEAVAALGAGVVGATGGSSSASSSVLGVVVDLDRACSSVVLVFLFGELLGDRRRCRSPRRFSSAAISSVSIPASASTWWRRSSVPEARCGGFSERTRSRPSISA